jgi:arylsulfatase A-like enzyme
MVLNVDFAPTFLEIAGAAIPKDMQGKSFLSILKGEHPAGWRKSWYYRYYHDPGDHNTRAHYGVRTETHKLIYFWKKDQWECYDLVKDPHELHNIYSDPASAALVADLKKELYRLKKEVQDNDEFALQQPKSDNGGPPKSVEWYKAHYGK